MVVDPAPGRPPWWPRALTRSGATAAGTWSWTAPDDTRPTSPTCCAGGRRRTSCPLVRRAADAGDRRAVDRGALRTAHRRHRPDPDVGGRGRTVARSASSRTTGSATIPSSPSSRPTRTPSASTTLIGEESGSDAASAPGCCGRWFDLARHGLSRRDDVLRRAGPPQRRFAPAAAPRRLHRGHLVRRTAAGRQRGDARRSQPGCGLGAWIAPMTANADWSRPSGSRPVPSTSPRSTPTRRPGSTGKKADGKAALLGARPDAVRPAGASLRRGQAGGSRQPAAGPAGDGHLRQGRHAALDGRADGPARRADHLVQGADPRGARARLPVADPPKALPGPGYVGVFDRSHYEDVLIARVRELAPPEEIERRYDAINAFEAELVAERHHDREVHAPHLRRRAEGPAAGPARRPDEALEVQPRRRRRAAALAGLPGGLRDRDRAHQHRRRAVARDPGRQEVVPQPRDRSPAARRARADGPAVARGRLRRRGREARG